MNTQITTKRSIHVALVLDAWILNDLHRYFGVTWLHSRPIDRINDAKELCPNFVSRKLSWFVHLGQATTQPRERRCFDSFMLLLFIFFFFEFSRLDRILCCFLFSRIFVFSIFTSFSRIFLFFIFLLSIFICQSLVFYPLLFPHFSFFHSFMFWLFFFPLFFLFIWQPFWIV